MSDIDTTPTETVESQVDDTQEATTDNDEELFDSSNQAEETDDVDNEESDDSDDTGDDTEETDETQTPPAKTKEDYIRERIARREERQALRQAQQQFAENLDPNDWEQRVQAIENERFIERVENNINNARRDVADAQNLPIFQNDPELFADVMQDAIENYGVFHDELREADGSPAFLGFYDKNGNQISLYDVAQREAARLQRVTSRTESSARIKAAQGEAKMRARADNPGGGKNTAPAFESLSASQQREALLKKGYDIK